MEQTNQKKPTSTMPNGDTEETKDHAPTEKKVKPLNQLLKQQIAKQKYLDKGKVFIENKEQAEEAKASKQDVSQAEEAPSEQIIQVASKAPEEKFVEEFISKLMRQVEHKALLNIKTIQEIPDEALRVKLMQDLENGLVREGERMHDWIQERNTLSIDKKPDNVFIDYPQKLLFAKFVMGGFIVASDINNNILIFDANTLEKLQCLPYGKFVSDAVASPNHIFVAIEYNKVLILKKEKPFIVVDKVDTSAKILALVRNERNEIRVTGREKMSFYIKEHTFQTETSSYKPHVTDLYQNLHCTKRGTDSWLVWDDTKHILCNYDFFRWIAYDQSTKRFCQFQFERAPMTEHEFIALKGSSLLKVPGQKFLDIKFHPDWWMLENNFALLMTPDEAVYLTHIRIKTGHSVQNVQIDRKQNGIQKLDWWLEDGQHRVLGLKSVKNEGEEATRLWVARLSQEDIDKATPNLKNRLAF